MLGSLRGQFLDLLLQLGPLLGLLLDARRAFFRCQFPEFRRQFVVLQLVHVELGILGELVDHVLRVAVQVATLGGGTGSTGSGGGLLGVLVLSVLVRLQIGVGLAIEEVGAVELAAEFVQVLVEWRGYYGCCSFVHVDAGELAATLLGHGLPARCDGVVLRPAVDGVDDHIHLLGELGQVGELHLRILVGLFVAADEDQLERVLFLAEVLLRECALAHTGHVFVVPGDAQGVELLVHLVEVGGEVHFLAGEAVLGGILATLSAVAVDRHAEPRRGLHRGQLVDDVPKLELRTVDEALHTAGHIQADDQIDRLGRGLHFFGSQPNTGNEGHHEGGKKDSHERTPERKVPADCTPRRRAGLSPGCNCFNWRFVMDDSDYLSPHLPISPSGFTRSTPGATGWRCPCPRPR